MARCAVPRGLRAMVAGLCMAAGMAVPARADIWAYVDARGVAHFAAERLDDRYELFFRGGIEAQQALGVAPAAPLAPAPAALPEGRPEALPSPPPDARTTRLAAFIEAAPGYREASPLLREASASHRIDYELLKALVAAESGFDPQAVSPKGAIGLMQVMPATAERFGVAGDARLTLERKLADPRTNVRTGSRYLRHLMDLFPGRLDLALAAYNAGEGAVQRAGQRIPEFRETQNYVRTVMQLYAWLKPGGDGARAAGSSRDAGRAVAGAPAGAMAGAAPAPSAAVRPSALTPALSGFAPGRARMPPPLLPPAQAPSVAPQTPAILDTSSNTTSNTN
jgi:soluble lytic murein transglycosylase-like protein